MADKEIYDEPVKPLPTSERFRLATLVLNEMPPQSIVDVRDGWDGQDIRDVTAFPARLFETEYAEDKNLAETR